MQTSTYTRTRTQSEATEVLQEVVERHPEDAVVFHSLLACKQGTDEKPAVGFPALGCRICFAVGADPLVLAPRVAQFDELYLCALAVLCDAGVQDTVHVT